MDKLNYTLPQPLSIDEVHEMLEHKNKDTSMELKITRNSTGTVLLKKTNESKGKVTVLISDGNVSVRRHTVPFVSILSTFLLVVVALVLINIVFSTPIAGSGFSSLLTAQIDFTNRWVLIRTLLASAFFIYYTVNAVMSAGKSSDDLADFVYATLIGTNDEIDEQNISKPSQRIYHTLKQSSKDLGKQLDILLYATANQVIVKKSNTENRVVVFANDNIRISRPVFMDRFLWVFILLVVPAVLVASGLIIFSSMESFLSVIIRYVYYGLAGLIWVLGIVLLALHEDTQADEIKFFIKTALGDPSTGSDNQNTQFPAQQTI